MSDCTDGIGLFRNNYGTWKSCSWLDVEWKLRRNCGSNTYIQTELGSSCRASCWMYNGCPSTSRYSSMRPTTGILSSTRRPVAKTQAPVAKTQAPVAKTQAPVAKSKAPVAKTKAPGSSPTGTPTRYPTFKRFIQPSIHPITKLLILPSAIPINRLPSTMDRNFPSLLPTHAPTLQGKFFNHDDTSMNPRVYPTIVPTRSSTNTTIVGSIKNDPYSDAGTKRIALTLGCTLVMIVLFIIGGSLCRKKGFHDGKRIPKSDPKSTDLRIHKAQDKDMNQMDSWGSKSRVISSVPQENQIEKRDTINHNQFSTTNDKVIKGIPSYQENDDINFIDERLRVIEGAADFFSWFSLSSPEKTMYSNALSTRSSLTKDNTTVSLTERSNVAKRTNNLSQQDDTTVSLTQRSSIAKRTNNLFQHPAPYENNLSFSELVPAKTANVKNRDDMESKRKRRIMPAISNMTFNTIKDVPDIVIQHDNPPPSPVTTTGATVNGSTRFVSWCLPTNKPKDIRESSLENFPSIEESVHIPLAATSIISGHSMSIDESAHLSIGDDNEKGQSPKMWKLPSLFYPKPIKSHISIQPSTDYDNVDSSTMTSGSISLNTTSSSSLASESLLFILMDEGRRILNCETTFDESSQRK